MRRVRTADFGFQIADFGFQIESVIKLTVQSEILNLQFEIYRPRAYQIDPGDL